MILIPILFTAVVTYLTFNDCKHKESSQQIRERVINERGGK